MPLFRDHRASLDESMDTVRAIADHTALVAHLAAALQPYGAEVRPDMVTVEPYGHDARIGWDTHMVRIAGYGVAGFTDGPV